MPSLMHHALEQAADRFGERDALLAGDRRWSFRELDDAADRFRTHLAAHGVGPGDRVAVMTTNRPEFVVAVHGISKLGAASVLLSPAWKAVEVGHALDLTGPGHAVADGPAVALLGGLLGADRVTDLDDPAAVEDGPTYGRSELPVADGSDERESLLVFSSGTTGLPKAVRHTHRSIGHATQHWVDCLGLTADDLDRVVDDRWDPPVTLGVRLVSVVNEVNAHLGQAQYLRGMLERR